MTPMTLAEKEASRRVCEMLGAIVCGLLVWYILTSEASSTNSFHAGLAPFFALTCLVIVAYGGSFVLLDKWWCKVYAQHGLDVRPNWAILPFLAAWVVVSNVFGCLGTNNPNRFYGESWLAVTLGFTLLWGLVSWCIMFAFWCLGFAIRTVRDWDF